jgi:colicin import membrane protein
MREELAREQAAEQERQLKALAARAQASARDKALAEWVGKIRSKIRGNIPTQVVQDVAGNPEAVFDVALLPTGEVLTVRMRKSSGNRAYDEAIERAILKASPLPRPDQASLFRRDLELKFRPLDQ